jgi:3-mercaptopyruvate sulfurtransferase SseA
VYTIKSKPLLALAFLVLAALACNALASPTAKPIPTPIIETFPTQEEGNIPLNEAQVPRVPLEEMVTAYNAGTAIIVDVRGKAAYDASHIPGARNIPLGEFETNIENIDLPKDAWIITYCT